MDFVSKKEQLSQLIADTLLPLVQADYVYWDLPYYTNIGDTLIWQGTCDFLKNVKYRCLSMNSKDTWRFKRLNPSTVILLQGGGNFGDLWVQHQDFRLKIIQQYPNNRIIILPQTVFFNDEKRMQADAKLMAQHKDLHICARDNHSFELLQKHFSANHLYNLPDMAFCINPNLLKSKRVPSQPKTLLLKRTDKELADCDFTKYIIEPEEIELHDWPTMEQYPRSLRILDALLRRRRYLRDIPDIYANMFFRKDLVETGIAFVSCYQNVYTTRLHVAILSVLLEKPFVFFDNSYGKNKQFYDSWLSDVEQIRFIG